MRHRFFETIWISRSSQQVFATGKADAGSAAALESLLNSDPTPEFFIFPKKGILWRST
jgi:hypothetical protein